MSGAALTPEPTPEEELEALNGGKLKSGARVFVHSTGTWWKVDGLWYRYGGR